MKYYEVALIKSARSSTELLTYHSNKPIQIGTVCRVSLRGKPELGVIINEVPKPGFKTNTIGDSLGIVIDKDQITLAKWISEYYDVPIGASVRLLVPSGIEKNRRVSKENPKKSKILKEKNKLTKNQTTALKKLTKDSNTSLLFGVTGSGKTRLYIELAKKVIAEGKSVIVLVPEIALTSQLVSQFESQLANILVTHSNMTPAMRHKVWNQVYQATQPQVIIGPRSALFSPVKMLGLVVIDESHDESYKQNTSPRYDARKVARRLCDIKKAKLVLGSATPSVANFYLAETKSSVIKLNEPIRSVSGRKVELVDMRKAKTSSPFSEISIKSMTQALKNKEQILVYHNRRGSAPIVQCSNCGWTAKCPNCHIPMVLHHDTDNLKCHVCGRSQKLPTSCPECSNTEIIYKGFGTKTIESELMKMFPRGRISRFDTDSKKAETMAELYESVRKGDVDIIVGTQMIAKGLDLPKLNTGIVISADTGLSMPDYSTNEKIFQLIHQVIGRVGRHSQKSIVIVQTRSPENQLIKLAVKQDYENFYKLMLEERKIGKYPPFKHLLLLTCSYASPQKSRSAATSAKEFIVSLGLKVHISGPTPSFYERRGSNYRWQILVKSSNRNDLVKISHEFKTKNKWTVELDPVSLL